MKIFLRRIKILACFLICSLLCVGLTACNFDRKTEYTTSSSAISEVEYIPEETVSQAADISTEVAVSSEPEISSEAQVSSETNVSSEPQVSSAPQASSKPKTSSVPQPSSTTQASKAPAVSAQPEQTKPPVTVSSKSAEMRAVWISFLEYQKILRGKTEEAFRSEICVYFDNCAEYGLNTVIVQARSHGDAYYKSVYFPSSINFTVTRQNSFPFDPLKIMVEEAHKRGLKIEAWVNPYRGNKTTDGFAPDDPVKKWLGTDKVFKFGNREANAEYYYFNPGEPEVRELVIKGIIEIVENYNVDGIHFDDYFYPTADSGIDLSTYQKYGAGRTLLEFRTDCVNELIASVYREIKARKNITFGIAPAGNINNCINKSCADVRLWGSTKGYVDYLAPQLYWDYGEGTLPFETALSSWQETVTNPDIKLIIGLAAYKVVNTPSDFWSSGDILKRQVEDSRKIINFGGFSIFRYENFFSDRLDNERNNLKRIMG